MKITITRKSKDIFQSFIIIIMAWGILSTINSPHILPSPITTFKGILKVLMDAAFFLEVWITLKRLFVGLFSAVLLGSILGLLIGVNKRISHLFEPIP